MNLMRRNKPTAVRYVEVDAPMEHRFQNRQNGSVWVAVTVSETPDGDLWTLYEVPTSERWTYGICPLSGAQRIFPENKAIRVYTSTLFSEFFRLDDSYVSDDHFAADSDFFPRTEEDNE